MRKIVFFDIDGTLFYPKIGIPHSAIRAVKQMISKGHKAILCTGRAMGMVPKEYLDLGFHGIVAAAGAHVICEGKELKNSIIDDIYIEKIIDYGKKEHIGTVLEGTLAGYYDESMLVEPYFKQVVDRLLVNTTKDNYPIDEAVSMINKWTYHHLNPDKVDEVEDMLDGKVTPVIQKRANAVEFIQKGMNKATGAREAMDYFGVDKENSYAFGDSENDIELLQYVNYGVAMGNSVPELLEIAEYKTMSVDKDGIALGLKKFGLV